MSPQVLLLVAEAVGLAIGLLVLFRLRHRWGYVPLYVTVGAFQLLQVILARTIYVPIADGMLVSPGSVVAFPATLFALLLVYIWEDAHEARVLIYSLILANLLVSLAAGVFGMHLDQAGAENILSLSPEFFAQNGRVLIAGTVVLLMDTVLVILLFEAVRKITGRHVVPRAFLALALVLAIDSIAFVHLAFGSADWNLVWASIIGKTGAALVYAIALGAYVRFIEHPSRRRGQPRKIGRLFRALTYKERFEHAQSLAIRDGLTGLFNRTHFDTELERLLRASSSPPVGLLLLDLDDFKYINDQAGHAVGDQVLRRLAQVLKKTSRSSDSACRYGGDELAVIMPGARLNDAADLARRVMERLAAQAEQAESNFPAFSVTIGVASGPADGTTPQDLLERADQRLLAGKRRQRGQIVSSDEPAS